MSAATSSISDSVDEEKLNDFKLYCSKFCRKEQTKINKYLLSDADIIYFKGTRLKNVET